MSRPPASAISVLDAPPASAGADAPPSGGRAGVERLDSLTGLRFLAAIMVLLYHALGRASDYRIVDSGFASNLFKLGGRGVIFFFVLSGFVLTWSAQEGGRTSSFYRRRFARVWPVHAATWVVVACAILAASQPLPAGGALLSLVLLQSWVPHAHTYFAVNGVTWSLSCEAFFYAIHPHVLRTRFAWRRAGLHLALAGMALMVLLAAIQIVFSAGLPTANDLYFSPEFEVGAFLVGVAAAVAFRQGARVRLRLSTALLVALLAHAAMTVALIEGDRWFGWVLPSTLQVVVLAPVSVLVVLAAASEDKRGRRTFFSRGRLVRLGEWSFALYMTHTIILRALTTLLHLEPVSDPLLAVPLLAAYVGSAVAVSGLVFTLFERPLERRLRPRAAPAPAHAADPAVLAAT